MRCTLLCALALAAQARTGAAQHGRVIAKPVITHLLAVWLDTTAPTTLPFPYLSTDSAARATLYLRPAVEIEPLAYASAAREFRGAAGVGAILGLPAIGRAVPTLGRALEGRAGQTRGA